jgi:hypothetical protein
MLAKGLNVIMGFHEMIIMLKPSDFRKHERKEVLIK